MFDDLLLVELARTARPDAVRLFWDVDAPATLAEIGAAPDHPMRRVLPDLDLVLTYGGGPLAGWRRIDRPGRAGLRADEGNAAETLETAPPVPAVARSRPISPSWQPAA